VVHGTGHGRVAAPGELDESSLQRAPLKQHVAPAPRAAKADVRAESIDKPFATPARMRPAEPDDIPEQDLEDASFCHPAERIRPSDGHGSG